MAGVCRCGACWPRSPSSLFVSFVTFGLVRLAPGDPVLIVLGGRARQTRRLVEQLREQFGLVGDPITQYVAWLGRALQGDLGDELQAPPGRRRPHRRPPAASPSSSSPSRSSSPSPSAIPLGVLQARRRDSAVDYAGSPLRPRRPSARRSTSRPSSGVLVFAVWLGWLPAFGAGEGPLDQLRHLLLPAVALALGMIALTSRMTRSAMIEVLASDFIEAARAKGLPERTILVKHALRNALIPVLTVTSLQVGFLLVGTRPRRDARWAWAAWASSSPMRSRTATTRSSRRRCCSCRSRSAC